MVLKNLGESLRNTLKKIAKASTVDKKLISEVVRDIQRALLTADVNVKLVLELTKEVERRALEEKPLPGMSGREHVIRIIYDELVKVLGGSREITLKKHIIMMVGLYGQGKTTTIGKLSKFFSKKGLQVGVIAGDVHRPAAYEQLSQLAEQVKVPIYGEPGKKNAVRIVKNGLKKFAKKDIVIIDTSGRHSLEQDLIDEMENIYKISNADERFLVLDAAVGQQAGPQAKAFHEKVHITGVILTKLDGTAKGGGAISAVSVTKAPIVIIGTGEHLDDLEMFDPPRFISRLLGMGDIQTLLEKAQEVMDEKSVEDSAKKLMTGKFTLKDMYEQMEMLTKMGPLQKIMNMLPTGFGGQAVGGGMSDQAVSQAKDNLKRFRVIMDSMTDEEMEKPDLIKHSRLRRISRGAGVDAKDVKALLKYHKMSKKAMKGLTSNRKMRKKMMKQFKMGDLPGM